LVCVKGATVLDSIQRDRLLYPMVRDRLDQPFQRISWDEALDAIVARIQTVRRDFGPEALCMYGSGQFVTEDYYTAQKLIKGCLGSNNFDANSRLCMSSAVSGYLRSFGSDGPPCCYDDLETTDCLFAVGTNTADCHPIVFNRFRRHHKTGRAKLVVVDPRCTDTAKVADLHLAIRPGTDIDLFNGIAHLLIRWDKLDRAYIAAHTNGFDDYAAIAQHYPPERTAERCQIPVEQVEQAARLWAESERVLSLWSMGLNQFSEGTAKVRTLINLHLMTAQIGKPGAGPFSLTGQPNAMGGREAGGLSRLLPGYRTTRNPQHRAEVEQAWQLPPGSISDHAGRSAWEIIEGLEQGEVQFLWIAATNPVVSMPDLGRTKAALARSPFTVYQEAYNPTETVEFAHLLLPATQWSEKTGTMTNSERVVTLSQGFQAPPGEAREDWAIFAEVGRRLGFAAQFPFTSAAEVHREFVQLTRDRPCDMTGISHDRLAREGPLQWPCPEESSPASSASDLLNSDVSASDVPASDVPASDVPSSDMPSSDMSSSDSSTSDSSTSDVPSSDVPSSDVPPNHKRLYTDGQFHTPDRRAQFIAVHSRGLAEPPDPDYPFVLTTGRLYGHWHTQTRTGRIAKIHKMHPEPFLEIHPRDADKYGITDGQPVQVRSRRGEARVPAKVTTAIAPGTLFIPMHWGSLWAEAAAANDLTHPALCPDSLEPELKACAVAIAPL
jgi:ferredoxin-nitrate reductase